MIFRWGPFNLSAFLSEFSHFSFPLPVHHLLLLNLTKLAETRLDSFGQLISAVQKSFASPDAPLDGPFPLSSVPGE